VIAALSAITAFAQDELMPVEVIFYPNGTYFDSNVRGELLCVSHIDAKQIICVPMENYDPNAVLMELDTL
tara:strand:- start:6438 stop:6647 length:210 start_codon:yes stop_codon:yes gene_type:complete